MTGTGKLVRFLLRRDRLKLPAWLAGLALFIVYVAAAVPQIAPTPEELAATSVLFNSPTARMWVGPGYGMDAVTYERFFAAGYALYAYLLVGLMNMLLITRHTRAEEQSGRAELVRANVVGRHAPLTAALVVSVLANVLVAGLTAGMLIAAGYAVQGSLLVGATAGFTGLMFAGITAVTVQLTENSRSAAGLAGGVLGVMFMVRAVGDMAEPGGSALSWASPLGWALQTAPYVLDRWWPLALIAGVAVVAFGLAYALLARRDFGGGLLPARRGPARARPWLGTPLGLAWRLHRSGALWWGAAIGLFALVDGMFAQAMLDAATSMPPLLLEMFGGVSGMAKGYLAFLGDFSAYLTVAYVVFAMQVLVVEEHRGRAEAVLATPTSRGAWAGSHVAVVAFNASVIMIVAGLLAGLAYAAATDDWTAVGTSVVAHLNLAPGVWVVLGLATLLFGWAPRLLSVVGWLYAGFVGFGGVFASLLNIPDWVMSISPFTHLATVPVEEFELVPVLVLTVIAVLAVVVGLAGLRVRQVVNKG